MKDLRSFGLSRATGVIYRLIENESEPSHLRGRAHRERGAADAVDLSIQSRVCIDSGASILIREEGGADVPPARLTLGQDLHRFDPAAFHDDTQRDRLDLSDLFEDPGAAVTLDPVANA